MNAIFESGLDQISISVLFWLLHLGWIGLVIGVVGWIGERALAGSTAVNAYRWNMFSFLFLIVGALVAVVFSANTAPQIARVQPIDSPDIGFVAFENGPSVGIENRNLNLESRESEPISSGPAAPVENPFKLDRSLTGQPIAIAQFETWTQSRILATVAIAVSVFYLLGCFFMLIRLVMASWGCRRLARSGVRVQDQRLIGIARDMARELDLRIAPVLATCERVMIPVLIGVFRPVVLLPASIISELTPDQLRAILAHEMAHLKRYDHLVVIFQRIAEAILFFHPTTWWLSRRLDSQRELCCDDLVLQTGTSRLEYAETLYLVASSQKNAEDTARARSELIALAADGANASEVLVRISRVLNEALPSTRVAKGNFWAANFGVGIFLVGLPALLMLSNFLNSDTHDSSMATVPVGETFESVGQDAYGVIRGVVKNEKGERLTGATVIVQESPLKYQSINATLPADPERVKVPPIVFAKSKTEMDGEFEFSNIKVPDFQKYLDSPFPITVLVIHDDYGMTWRHLKSSSVQKLDYTLTRGAPISFKVESNMGEPLKNVTAKLFGTMTKHDWNNVHPYRRVPAELIHQGVAINPAIPQDANGLVARDDQAGSPEFATDKANADTVAVFEVGAEGHATDRVYVTNVDIDANPGELKSNDYGAVLANGSTIRLRQVVNLKMEIIGSAGKPVAGVKLKADKFVRTKTRKKLIVKQTDRPGVFEVAVNSEPDGKPFKMHLRAEPTVGPFLNLEQMLEIDPAKSNQTFKIELAEGIPLKGKVVDADSGTGLQGVAVQFLASGKIDYSALDPNGPFHRSSFGKSNADGEFTLNVPLDENGELPEGAISAKARVEGFRIWNRVENTTGNMVRAVQVQVDPSNVNDLVLRLPPDITSNMDSFQVKVLDENGKPASRAKVRFHCTYTNGNTGIPKTQRTDQNGLLQLENEGAIFNFKRIAIIALSKDEKSAATAVYDRPEKVKSDEEIVRYMKQLRKEKSPDEPSFVLTANLKPLAIVSGQVIDASTDKPIPFAKVRAQQYNVEKIDIMKNSISLANFFPFIEADKDGFFEMKAVPNLRCQIEAVHQDYLERRHFSDADYFTPSAGQMIDRSVRLAAKKVASNGKVKPVVLPDLGNRKGVEALDYLKDAFGVAQQKFRQGVYDGDAVDAQVAGRNSPATVYLPTIIRIADANKGSPAELKALVWACSIPFNTSEDQKMRYKQRTEIGNRLMKDYIESPEIKDCLDHLIYSQPNPKLAAEKILASNKNKAVQGNALLLIGQSAVSELSVRAKGFKHTECWKSMTDEELEAYAHKTYTRIKEECAEVPYWRHENLGTIAAMQLFEFEHLGVGDEVEDIVGEGINGMPLTLSDHRGKLVVLDFWGSWCGPCISELPKLNKIAKDFESDLVVLGVMNDSIADAKKVLREHDVQWQNWVEPDDGPIQTRWNIDSWPTTYLIDEDGKVIAKSLRGQKLYDAIEKHVEMKKKKK